MRALVQTFRRFKASAVTLIVANLVPLIGVLFWDWDAFEIVALYWTENVVIGLINVLKMITCASQPAMINWDRVFTPAEMAALENTLGIPPSSPEDSSQLEKIQAAMEKAHKPDVKFSLPGGIRQPHEILQFVLFYGGACLLHGMIVLTVFGHQNVMGEPIKAVVGLSKSAYQQFLLPVLALAASHLYSFFVNYLARGEYRRVTVGSLLVHPYGRVVVLHLAILFAGFIAATLGSPLPFLVLLVIGKTALDLMFHLREREQNAAEPAVGS
jgi:hypothetical protein